MIDDEDALSLQLEQGLHRDPAAMSNELLSVCVGACVGVCGSVWVCGTQRTSCEALGQD